MTDDACVVPTLAWTPLKGQPEFWGVWSRTPFTKFENRETFGTDDNEFYGGFYTGVTAAVPEPAMAALWLLGLAAVAAALRRRSAPGAPGHDQ